MTASRVVGAIPSWSEPRLLDGQLFWLERRPQEGGRTRLLVRDCDPLPPPETVSRGDAPPARQITPDDADEIGRAHV